MPESYVQWTLSLGEAERVQLALVEPDPKFPLDDMAADLLELIEDGPHLTHERLSAPPASSTGDGERSTVFVDELRHWIGERRDDYDDEPEILAALDSLLDERAAASSSSEKWAKPWPLVTFECARCGRRADCRTDQVTFTCDGLLDADTACPGTMRRASSSSVEGGER